MDKVIIRKINDKELTVELFSDFDRYQKVNKCWRKREGKWVLIDNPFTEQWTDEEYEFLVKCLKNTLKTGGVIEGAFVDNKLKGFISIENEFFGLNKEYVQLSSIHMSYDMRGKGIGKKLFTKGIEAGRQLGAKKLYISAHSSEESQAFYKAMGCVEAKEYNKKLTEAEPCDCQLEFVL